MSEEKSRKARKTGNPKVVKKPEALTPEPEDNAIANQPKFEIEHSTSEIKPMEIHHHPEVEKKTFKQYVLEGLMIFLAVFMGFIAENIREKISDHNKEREYVINIKKELVEDTVNLAKWIPSVYSRMAGVDTLIDYLSTPGYVKDGSNMYFLARVSTRSLRYNPVDNTLKELKNSGDYRLIRSQEFRRGLIEYENTTDFYTNLYGIELRENEMSYPLIGNLFDATVFVKMASFSKGDSYHKEEYTGARRFIHKPTGNPQLRVQNSDEINLLIYDLHQRETSMYGEAKMLKTESMNASALIKLIDKTYGLRDGD